MSLDRRAALAVLIALSLPVVAAAAPDCDGGSVVKLHVAPHRVAFQGTVTRAGATHATFVGSGPLQLRLVAPDGTLLYAAVDIPPERFVTNGTKTRYDHGGAFRGDVVLKDARGQADTVRIVVRDANPNVVGTIGGDVRASITTGAGCARTCVAPCTTRSSGQLACHRSDVYVPFADT